MSDRIVKADLVNQEIDDFEQFMVDCCSNCNDYIPVPRVAAGQVCSKCLWTEQCWPAYKKALALIREHTVVPETPVIIEEKKRWDFISD